MIMSVTHVSTLLRCDVNMVQLLSAYIIGSTMFVNMGRTMFVNTRTWGYRHILQFYGSVGPLECIFMAPLTLSSAGVPADFFHLMEAPTMRLPNVKILICWPSRMQIYGFVENHIFLEQFVSMGLPA